jgi:transposase
VVLDEMHTWLMQTRGELLPKNPAAEAITYALNQWEALKRYTEAAYLAIDNNVAEREMRPVAIGRKNWLFAGSDEGGRTAATLSSLIRSATRHGLNVEYYLRSVLAHLPTTKLSELHHLLPDEWKRDLAAEESRRTVNR